LALGNSSHAPIIYQSPVQAGSAPSQSADKVP
jgi:hypothetical protein